MFGSLGEQSSLEISPRLRNALVADLIQKEQDVAEVDRLLTDRMDELAMREHLGRQFGFTTIDGLGDIGTTLSMLLPELDRMLRDWPLPADGNAAAQMAAVATKSLTGPEAYATLLAGPGRWGKQGIGADRRVSNLDVPLRETLERCLAASLNELLQRWAQWNIPKLRLRWQEAKQRQQSEAAAGAIADDAHSGKPRRRSTKEKADKAKWRAAASYRPPGRAY